MARFDFSDVGSKDTAASQVDGLLQIKDRSGVDGGTPDSELCPEIVDNTMPASLVMQFLLLLYRNLLVLRRNYVSCVNSFPMVCTVESRKFVQHTTTGSQRYRKGIEKMGI